MSNGGKKKVEVLNLDISTPLDIKAGTSILGGSEQMYYNMLGRFEDMTLFSSLIRTNKGVDTHDNVEVKEGAHALKGASGYIGASHI